MKSVMFFSQMGCLLPLFIILNLFFGLAFFKFSHWVMIELGLIGLLMLNSIMVTKKIYSYSKKRSNVIDVEGRVVEEKQGRIE